jgi:hypothetical protein
MGLPAPACPGLLSASAADKGIVRLLLTDGCFWTVAGQEARFIRQGVDLGSNALLKRIPVAAGQIRTANRALKDQVATKADSFLRAVEHDMTRRMPGRVADLKRGFPQAQELAGNEINGGLGAGVDAVAEKGTTSRGAPEGVIGRVQRHQWKRVQRVRDGGRAANVIEVSMGIPEVGDPPAAPPGLGQYQISVPGGIDHCGVTGGNVGNKVGIGLNRSEGEGDDRDGHMGVTSRRGIRLAASKRGDQSGPEIGVS